ncbi:MAG: decarboxylase [Verrucomicrobiales bacterium]|nr:decarboxylase [Verrucomicrobiales bacterium]
MSLQTSSPTLTSAHPDTEKLDEVSTWQFREDLALRYGTPIYAYDLDRVKERYDSLRSLFPEKANPQLMYSFKANPLPSVAGELEHCGACADLTSPGEIRAAMEAGFDLSKALYGGPGKNEVEFLQAIGAGIRQFSVESEVDLRALSLAAERAGQLVRALIRINPAEPPKAKLAMSGVASQFGFEESYLRENGKSVLQLKSDLVTVEGVHIYWGTQIGDPEALLACFSKTISIAEELSESMGFHLAVINFGGGFPWPYAHEGEGPDLSSLREELQQLFDDSSAAAKASWWFESGRYLVGSSGSLITRVMDLKTSKDDKQYLIVDTGIHHLGGMSGLGRIPRFSIELLVPEERKDAEEITVDVVGQLCTPLDCIGKKIKIPKPEVGDLLVIPNVGAYGMTASVCSFLSRPAPAEVAHRADRVIAAHRLRTGHESIV